MTVTVILALAAAFVLSLTFVPAMIATFITGRVSEGDNLMIRALKGEPITFYGDGRQVRDILHVRDAVAAYRAALARIDRVAGRAFNLGGGPDNAVSLRGLIAYLGTLLDREVGIETGAWRPGDQRYYVSDTRRAASMLGLEPPLPWREGVADLAAWLTQWLAAEAATSRAARQPEAVL